MDFYLSAILLGLAYCGMGLGIYITLRIFNIPDITTDGSFTLGASVTAALLSQQYPIVTALLMSMIAGSLAGLATGIIHTRLKINPLLSGILVMTALYSVNLSIMGRSNIPLINTANLLQLTNWFQREQYNWLLLMAIVALGLWCLISWLLKTDFGLSMRATGNSETMIRALGVNTDGMKVIGLMIANALTALSGFLVCQFQQFADINMGIGIVIFGLGAVMMGESLLNALRIQSIPLRLAGVIAGCILFRIIIGAALTFGINPNWLKLVTAVIVLVVVGLPNIKRRAGN
ncbi:MAG: ABC transporter permease [Chitinophagaceae bacterium]|nr:ABC transporter permease [Chitinophagaceae bacterium]